MADVTYVISIRDETGGKGSSSGEAQGASAVSQNGGVAPTSKGERASGFHLSKKQKINLGIVAAKKIGHRVATTYINQVGIRTGNTTLQEKLAYTESCIERGLAIGTTVITGAVTGNPLMVAAGIGSAISWGVDISVAQEQIKLQRAVENIGISQANIRAGAGGDRFGKATY